MSVSVATGQQGKPAELNLPATPASPTANAKYVPIQGFVLFMDFAAGLPQTVHHLLWALVSISCAECAAAGNCECCPTVCVPRCTDGQYWPAHSVSLPTKRCHMQESSCRSQQRPCVADPSGQPYKFCTLQYKKAQLRVCPEQ